MELLLEVFIISMDLFLFVFYECISKIETCANDSQIISITTVAIQQDVFVLQTCSFHT